MTKLNKSQNIGFVIIFFIIFGFGIFFGYQLGKDAVVNTLDEHGYTFYESGRMVVETQGGHHYLIDAYPESRSIPEDGCWYDKSTGYLWLDIPNLTNKTSIQVGVNLI